MSVRWPLIKSCQSKFPLMSLIGANALPLLAHIKAREDGESHTSCLPCCQRKYVFWGRKKSGLDNSLIERRIEHQEGTRTILKREKGLLQDRRLCKKG